jgi:hypothetical protein
MRNDGVRARTRIEVRIGQLIIDDLGTGSPDALLAAMTTELQAALARELTGRGRAGELARSPGLSADRVRATVSLPPAAGTNDGPGAGPGAAGAGRVIGAALARVVAGQRDQARPGSPARPRGAAR